VLSQINNMIFFDHDLMQKSTQHTDKTNFIGFGENRKCMCIHLIQETYKYNKYAFVIPGLYIKLILDDGESSNFMQLQKYTRLVSD